MSHHCFTPVMLKPDQEDSLLSSVMFAHRQQAKLWL